MYRSSMRENKFGETLNTWHKVLALKVVEYGCAYKYVFMQPVTINNLIM